MAKKKNNKPAIVNNIESIQMDIDYEKLANAIVKAQSKAEEQKLQNEKNRIKNTKLSKFSILKIAILSIFALICLVFGLVNLTITAIDLQTRLINSFRFLYFSIAYAFLAFVQYAISKNRNQNFVFNMLSVVLAFATFILAITY